MKQTWETSVQMPACTPAQSDDTQVFRVSLDLVPEAALIYSIDGRILEVNAALVEIFEAASADELIGKIIYSLGVVKTEQVSEAFTKISRGEAIRFEINFLTLKGTPLRLAIMGIPLLSPTGKVERVLGIGHDITRQKAAESEQSLLVAVVNASGDAIINTSLDSSILSWNGGAEKLFGVPAKEALGRGIFEFVSPEEHGRVSSAMSDLSRTGKPTNLSVHSLRKDGTTFESWVNFFPTYDVHGKFSGVGAIGRNITEMLELQRQQVRLAAIVEASGDAILTATRDGRISYWNPGAERTFGFTAAEAIGQPLTLHIPPEHHLHAQEITNQILAHPDQVVRFEGPNIRKDGTRLEVSTACFAIRDGEGKVVAISAIQRDVTQTKRAERENVALAAIVNASHDAIINVSPEARIMTWNSAAEKAYGYPAEEAIGKGIELFVPPEELAQTIATTQHVAQSRQPASWEQHARRRDGTRFISAVNIFPIHDAVGNVTGVAGIGRDITQLKQIETDLREARDYTRGLIESSVDAMVVVDRDLRISDGNEQLAKLTEVPKKILIGSRFDSYFTEPELAVAAIEKALADGSITNYDLVLRATSGKEILVSFNASFFSRAGAVSGIFGVARDVTEPRAIERKLAEERQYSRSLVESSPDALLVTNSELMLTDINAQTVRLTGYRPEDLAGVKLTAIFSEPERVTEVVRQALETGFVREVEACLLTKSAEQIPVSLNAAVFKYADGSTRGVIIGIRDVSEHKRAEKERSLLASIVNASGDAIYSESTDLTITSWNAAAERLFGYKASDIVGRNVAVLVPLAHRAQMLEDLSLISRSGKAERFETTRQRKDGNSVEVLLTRSPIFDSAHQVAGFSIIAHDIGDRKRAEAELTAARDAALEGARTKSEFLANMSHEIRTPLNSVIGMTGLLLDTQLRPEQREFANDVRESGEALLTLINEILDFSKLAAGKVVFEEVDFELTAAVEGAVDPLIEPARRKGLELTVSIDSEAPQGLRGDPGRLRQVLLNLIGNAIKFTERGEVAVQVSKLSESTKEIILRFEVRDSGIGIPKEKLHLLFQPFSQVDASTTRHFGGTGLGLSIARQLVERMGGTISVSSTPGSGSTFWFTTKFARPLKVANPASERFVSFAHVKVLIVDDNANSLRILGSQASAWKMEAETADSADHALKLMRAAIPEHPFEVALIDVQMPEADGIQLTRTIKSDPALAATVVILVSSVGTATDYRVRLQGLELGGWLTKPVPQSSLYNALVKVLARRDRIEPGARDATRTPEPPTLPPNGKLKLFAGRKLRVLLAEDNPLNQKLAKFQLKKMGAEVDCVANGREAVESVTRRPYDAVLMDCQLPEMDGYEATREIRRLEGSRRHTPIIALTAHALAGDRDTCLAAGMDAYVSKPVQPEILVGVLAQFITADAAPAADATATLPELSATNGPESSETIAQSQLAQPAQTTQPGEAQEPPHTLNGKAPA